MSFPRPILLKTTCAALFVLTAGVAPIHAQGAFPAPLPGAANSQPANASPFPPVSGAPARPAAAAPAASSPFPPVNGAPASAAPPTQAAFPSGGAAPVGGMGGGFGAPPPPAGGAGAQANCMAEFTPLRDDTEKRGKALKAASDRKATAQEACGLINAFSSAELKLLKYITTNSQRCGIPPEVAGQMKAGRANTEKMQKQVCAAAKQQAAGGGGGGPAPAPSLSEALGSVSVPEANANAKRSGGSTFDTLNGNVLSR